MALPNRGGLAACPPDSLVAALLAGAASEEELDGVHGHAAQCDACRTLLAAVARLRGRDVTTGATSMVSATPYEGDAQGERLTPGDAFGRFCILNELGRGGMGVVFAAEDPTLDRIVAIKLVRPRRVDHPERLTREARAMAKVKHPNVVGVHEAGEVEGRLYIVMDYIDGPDLRRWLAARPTSVGGTLRRFIEAGRGLEAVHAVGLVHRDFKPQNVLVGSDGVARVTDFGLVAVDDASRDAPSPDLYRLASDLTEEGAVLGTPRYMAPEQLRGDPATPAADQFAFCVSLYEAVAGVNPFPSYRKMRLDAIVSGHLAPPAEDRPLSAALERVLRRGLAEDPGARFPDMAAVVAELESVVRAPRRRARAMWAALALGGAAAAGVAFGAREPPPCPADNEFAGVWEDDQRAHARRALSDAGLPATVQERVVQRVDDYASAWSDMRHEACAATKIRGETSAAGLELRAACLRRRKNAVRASLEVGLGDDGGDAAALPVLVRGLPSIDTCWDLERLSNTRARPDDPELRARLDAAELELDRLLAMVRAGQEGEVLRRAEALVTEAEAIGWPPMVAQALNIKAYAVGATDDELAVETWKAAYAAAADSGNALALRVALEGVDRLLALGRGAEAKFLLDLAEAHRTQLGEGEPSPLHFAMRASVAIYNADPQAAEKHLKAAVAAQEPDRVDPTFLANLGAVRLGLGDLDGALSWTQRALAAAEAENGPAHAVALALRFNLGVILYKRDAYDDAEQTLRRVLAGQIKLERRVDQALTLLQLSDVLRATERPTQALDYAERALAIQQETRGTTHPRVALALAGAARAELALGRNHEAIARLRDAARQLEPLHGYAQEVAEVHADLAQAHLAVGAGAAAATSIVAARQALERQGGGDPQLRSRLERLQASAAVDERVAAD